MVGIGIWSGSPSNRNLICLTYCRKAISNPDQGCIAIRAGRKLHLPLNRRVAFGGVRPEDRQQTSGSQSGGGAFVIDNVHTKSTTSAFRGHPDTCASALRYITRSTEPGTIRDPNIRGAHPTTMWHISLECVTFLSDVQQVAGEHAPHGSLRHVNCTNALRIAMLKICRCTTAPIHEVADKYRGGHNRPQHRTDVIYGGGIY